MPERCSVTTREERRTGRALTAPSEGSAAPAVTLEQMRELVGRPFPGGRFAIEHWENTLFTEVMARDPMPDGLAHPAYLFHAPLAGLGLTYGDIFELCHAESPEAIRAGEYRWTVHQPLRVGHTYAMSGAITGVERKEGRRAGKMDLVSFEIAVHDIADDSAVATVVNTWIFLRSS
jgi:hypothetical protein